MVKLSQPQASILRILIDNGPMPTARLAVLWGHEHPDTEIKTLTEILGTHIHALAYLQLIECQIEDHVIQEVKAADQAKAAVEEARKYFGF